MIARALWILLASLLLGTFMACPPPETTPPPPNDEPPPAPRAEHLPNVTAPELILANAERQPDRDALPVLQRLEEPRDVNRETRPNPHQPQEMDTLYVYHYDGLELDFMRTHLGREIIRALEITHERYDTPEGVRVGMSRDQVRERMGEPAETEANEERYFIQIDEVGPEEPFAVEYRNDRVYRLRYGFYVD